MSWALPAFLTFYSIRRVTVPLSSLSCHAGSCLIHGKKEQSWAEEVAATHVSCGCWWERGRNDCDPIERRGRYLPTLPSEGTWLQGEAGTGGQGSCFPTCLKVGKMSNWKIKQEITRHFKVRVVIAIGGKEKHFMAAFPAACFLWEWS
ncbi:uncharacterized protein BDZ83DRAFT_135876 [Colletotrichum acutatum]|uniref:Uncharacterized protein n=1 Tax=Glomerella acutata TaxID=27357 RepID=A0AAD8X8R7_GLOAC|nr:uncharacterized protein BDZ83DRAFT_135876 [Colletotrichum acutatum]KAK1709718.1 hypothetical protein BDZ83DRAFT_135876 [Colletotrichum acutatum]